MSVKKAIANLAESVDRLEARAAEVQHGSYSHDPTLQRLKDLLTYQDLKIFSGIVEGVARYILPESGHHGIYVATLRAAWEGRVDMFFHDPVTHGALADEVRLQLHRAVVCRWSHMDGARRLLAVANWSR